MLEFLGVDDAQGAQQRLCDDIVRGLLLRRGPGGQVERCAGAASGAPRRESVAAL